MCCVGDMFVENCEDVQWWVKGFVDGVERVLFLIGEVVIGIGKIGGIVWDVVEGMVEMVGGWENFGMVIGVVFVLCMIVCVVKFGVVVFSLGKVLFLFVCVMLLVVGGICVIGMVLMLNLIGLVVVGIVVVVYVIYKNWEYVGLWFDGFWGDVKIYF